MIDFVELNYHLFNFRRFIQSSSCVAVLLIVNLFWESEMLWIFPIESLFLFPNFWNSFSSHHSIIFNDFRIDYSHSYLQSDYKFTFKAFHWMLAKFLISSICSHLSRTRIRRACLEITYLIYFKFLKPILNLYK